MLNLDVFVEKVSNPVVNEIALSLSKYLNTNIDRTLDFVRYSFLLVLVTEAYLSLYKKLHKEEIYSIRLAGEKYRDIYRVYIIINDKIKECIGYTRDEGTEYMVSILDKIYKNRASLLKDITELYQDIVRAIVGNKMRRIF